MVAVRSRVEYASATLNYEHDRSTLNFLVDNTLRD